MNDKDPQALKEIRAEFDILKGKILGTPKKGRFQTELCKMYFLSEGRAK